MTEPVAYWNIPQLGDDEPFVSFEPSATSVFESIPLYTEEQLHPRVKMTKEQYEILVLSRNNAVNRVDKVGLLEFMSAYSLLNQEIDHLSLMQAWLHPENIKVVDE